MNLRQKRGVSTIEFAFSLLVLVPLFLGTGATGINMIKNLQVVQITRDIGNMYARKVDFSQAGNQTLLGYVGQPIGLSTTAGAGNAVVVLSSLTYVDDATCNSVGAASGTPPVHTGACTNFGYWVFTQRLTFGNSSVHSSNYGSPITTGPSGVTVNGTTGQISASDYVTKSGARATFSSVNPYSVVNGVAQGLPSGQSLYLAEVACTGFTMPPFVNGGESYSFGFF